MSNVISFENFKDATIEDVIAFALTQEKAPEILRRECANPEVERVDLVFRSNVEARRFRPLLWKMSTTFMGDAHISAKYPEVLVIVCDVD